MEPKLFLVDVDGTLLDTRALREDIGKRFEEKFGPGSSLKLWEVYKRDLENNGFIDLKKISSTLSQELGVTDPSQIVNIFLDSNFKDFLFPGALNSLEKFKKEGRVLIYSQGEDIYQPVKIKKSGIEDVVGPENVIIQNNKAQYLSTFMKRVEKEGYKEVVIIDNSPAFLEEAKKVFPEAKLVFVTEGKYNI